MKYRYILVLLILIFTLDVSFAARKKGVEKVRSNYTFTQTIERLEDEINKNKLKLFNIIDHRQNAQEAGLRLNPTTLFIVGNPNVGTPLMQCEQSFALDLPQKILVYEDNEGDVWILFNKQKFLKKRHKMKECDLNLEKVQAVLKNLVTEAAFRK